MPIFKNTSINFDQNRPKIKLFLQKIFERLGLRPHTPKQTPQPLRISCYELEAEQRWKPVRSTSTGWVDRPVKLPVGSRFFDRPVKLVEKPVKFSFFGTKKHLNTNQNILIYFIINKTFYKKSVLTNHTFQKRLLNGFKL